MPSSVPRICRLATIAGSLAAAAAALHADPVLQSEPVVVAETPLAADAAGATTLRVAPTLPVARDSLPAVADAIANLHVAAAGAGSFGSMVALRGVSNTPYFSDPAVAVTFDDLPLGGVFTLPTGLYGFTSVTVARGPQPTAAGRNGEAGAITFHSPTPGAAATGELRADLGNFAARTVAVTAVSARDARADASVSADTTRRDGYIANTELGTRVDDQQATTAAARVRVRPGPATEVTLQVLANRERDGAQPLVPIGGPRFTVARGREGATDSDFAGAALTLAFDTALGRLRATTSRTRWALDPYENRLVLPPPLDSRLTQRQAAWNEELRLGSDPRSAAPWQVGAWWSATDTSGAVNRAIPGLFPIEGSGFTRARHTAAVFGEATLPLGAGWRLIPAVRAEHTTTDFARTQTVPGPGYFAGSDRLDALLPKLTAVGAVGPATHLSAAVGFGVRPGGWSAYTDNPALAGFRPEKLLAFEAGLDTRIGRTLTLAARAFLYRIRDYQIERSFNATDYLVVNAPRARSLGGELEAAWRPRAGLVLTASAGVTELTLRAFTDPFTGRSYAGHHAPYAPAYDARLGAAYRTRAGWFAAADVTATGRTYFEESNAPATASPAHVTADARLGYDAPRWRLTLHAENIADAAYTTLVIPGVGHEVPGAPRTYGIEAALKW